MEWVETTARTVDEAKDLALDQLGVIADEAEFEVLESPRPGLFGRLRGEARVRARVRPTPVRPKQDRRRGRRPASSDSDEGRPADVSEVSEVSEGAPARSAERRSRSARRPTAVSAGPPVADPSLAPAEGTAMSSDDQPFEVLSPADAEVDVESVRQAAHEFISGLTTAFGLDATVEAAVDGTEIEVRVDGPSLGLMIGPGGRTLLGIQDLARVAAQRRLGDHETRLRVDVAGYREKRRLALERFAGSVAEQVRATGVARSLDPMPSADRKILHDTLAQIDGVSSRSEGEDPNRRVVVVPG